MGADRKRMTMAERIEAYFDGYRRIPEGDDPNSIALEKAWLEDLSSDDDEWPDAPQDDKAVQ